MQERLLKAVNNIVVLASYCFLLNLSFPLEAQVSFSNSLFDSLNQNGPASRNANYLQGLYVKNQADKKKAYQDLIQYCEAQDFLLLKQHVQYNFARYLSNEVSDSLAILQFEEILTELKLSSKVDSLLKIRTLYYLGKAQNWEGLYQEAISSYKALLTISIQTKNDPYKVLALLNIGANYDDLEETTLALYYLEAMYIEAQKSYANRPTTLASYYCSYLRRFPNGKEAAPELIDHYLEVIALLDQGRQPMLNGNYLEAHTNLGAAYVDINDFPKAKKALFKALSIANIQEDSTGLEAIYESLGAMYKRQARYDSALYYYDASYQLRLLASEDKSSDLNYSFHNIGEVYDSLANFEQAAIYYQKALQQAGKSFYSDNFNENPDWANDIIIGTKYDLIKDLDHKARLFYKWYQKEKNISHLKTAFSTYKSTIDLIYFARAELISNEAKALWQTALFSIFERALIVAHHYHKEVETKEQQQALLFDWIEKSKALVLLETLQRQQLEKEDSSQDTLKEQIEIAQDALNQLLRAKGDFLNPLDFRKQELMLRIQLAELEHVLIEKKKSNSPNLESTPILELSELQKNLTAQNQACLSYFLGQEFLFLLKIDQSSFHIFQVPNKGLNIKVEQLLNALNKEEQLRADISSYQQLAFELYQLLFAPVHSLLQGKEIEELIIIGDGVLLMLPFEILIAEAPSDNKPAYLLHPYHFSYAFSASTLWLQQKKKKKNIGYPYFGMAPSFKGNNLYASNRACTGDLLPPLYMNEEEVQKIHQEWGGEMLKGEEAVAELFLEKGLNAQIIHLATHACVDNSDPMQSKIYFYEDHLYAYEISQLKLAASMVVLSACETGVGAYQKGEGVISLARSFAEAGAPSLTMSYWSVSDASTAELMDYYFKYLKKGWPKHKALKQAKLDYLNSQEDFNKLHPFYWAPFVHIGDFSPIRKNDQQLRSYLIPTLIGMGLIGFFFLFRKRTAS